MKNYNEIEPINVGSGEAVSIAELARMLKEVIGFPGEFLFDTSKPDGMPVKLLDTTKLRALGSKPKITFRKALELTYIWFLNHEQVSPCN